MTPRRWWGLLCAAGAVLCFSIAGSYCTGCTTAERAPIERRLSSALTDENLACLLAQHVPGLPNDAHPWIVASCAVGPAATQAALALLEEADRLRLGDKDAGGP